MAGKTFGKTIRRFGIEKAIMDAFGLVSVKINIIILIFCHPTILRRDMLPIDRRLCAGHGVKLHLQVGNFCQDSFAGLIWHNNLLLLHYLCRNIEGLLVFTFPPPDAAPATPAPSACPWRSACRRAIVPAPDRRCCRLALIESPKSSAARAAP